MEGLYLDIRIRPLIIRALENQLRPARHDDSRDRTAGRTGRPDQRPAGNGPWIGRVHRLAQGTISLAGLQLSMLGAAAFLALALPHDRISNVRARKLIRITPMLCGAVIAVEGLLVLLAAAPIAAGGDVLPRHLVAAFGAQLFFLGSMLSYGAFKKHDIGTALTAMGHIGIMSAGLWTASIAETVVWTNFHGFHGRTVLAAGALLMALGAMGLLLDRLNDKTLSRKPLLNSLRTWGAVVPGALVAFGGLVGLSIADDVRFATQGGLSSATVSFVMFALFALGMMASMSWPLSAEDATTSESRARLAGPFLALLFPFAVLV